MADDLANGEMTGHAGDVMILLSVTQCGDQWETIIFTNMYQGTSMPSTVLQDPTIEEHF